MLLPRFMDNSKPWSLSDATLIAFYGYWSETFWAASFMEPDRASVTEFHSWLHDEVEAKEMKLLEDYELRMITNYRAQGKECPMCIKGRKSNVE